MKITVNRCVLSRKMNAFSAGAPDPTVGDYSAPPDLLAALRGPTSKGMEMETGKWRGRGPLTIPRSPLKKNPG